MVSFDWPHPLTVRWVLVPGLQDLPKKVIKKNNPFNFVQKGNYGKMGCLVHCLDSLMGLLSFLSFNLARDLHRRVRETSDRERGLAWY